MYIKRKEIMNKLLLSFLFILGPNKKRKKQSKNDFFFKI